MLCRWALICSTGVPGPKIVTFGPKSGVPVGAADAVTGASPARASAPVAASRTPLDVRPVGVRMRTPCLWMAWRSVARERGVGRLGRLHGAHGDGRGDRDDPHDQERGAQAVDGAAEAEDHQRADELTDEERGRPEAGPTAALLEGQRAQSPGEE